MRKVYLLVSLFFLFTVARAQLLTTTPDFPKETDAGIVITLDASKGNGALMGYNPADVYVHIGAITSFSTSGGDWRYVPFSWGTTNPAAKAVSLGNNKWSYTLSGADARAFFGITNPAEHILKIAILFRNGAGSVVQRNMDGSDMYVSFYEAGLQTKITRPFRQPTYVPTTEPISKNAGDTLLIEAKSSQSANLKLFFNGSQIATTTGTAISAIATILGGGNQQIVAEAESGGIFKRDTITFFVSSSIVVEALPAGVTDGINYEPGDTSVTLVLFAPGKVRSIILGDFNNWQPSTAYQMKKTPDGSRFWLRVTGLTPGTEYAYQYLVDNVLKIADYNTEKVLDPANDPYISPATYPGLKPYPTGMTSGIVSVLQTAKPQYNWSAATTSFTRPDKRNLIIYELLLRDFVAAHDWKTLSDTLTYLKRLGVNAVHLMPFNEFEGNNSWGYNTSFYLAPDKYYGPENDLRRFIDSAHAKGMAVLMDMVLNHAYGQSPMVQLYWDAANNRPAANSPWFNPTAPHTWLEFGYDFNHEAQATKDLTAKVIRHWLTKYKIDGFRWDFTKGFSQRPAPTEPSSAAYDASRIAILKRMYDTMQAVSPGSISILEHFATNTEEIELSNYGMLLWGNLNYNYNEASMGWLSNSNFQGVSHTQRGWSQPTLVGYAESHDEERLMFKNELYGNSSNPAHNVKDTIIGLRRQEMVAAFLLTVPGPKMIWQFGELGYDFSINRCEDGSINNNCRVNPKPIVWHYYQQPARRALFNVYANLNRLRTNPAYLGTFTSNDITQDLSAGIKWIKVNGPALRLMIVGNFDVVPQTASVTFQNAGTWYSYLTGTTITASGLPQNITLQPGEYYVYTNVNVPLPLNLLSFTGSRSTAGIQLQWTTEKEINVRNYELQRSINSSDFTTVYTTAAGNTTGTRATYQYLDRDQTVLTAKAPLYYRLKMNDADGKVAYSKVVLIASAKNEPALLLFPNPVIRNSTLSVQMAGSWSGKAELQVLDASGKVYSRQYISNSTGSAIVPVNVASLSSGMYHLKLVSSAGTVVKAFTIQH